MTGARPDYPIIEPHLLRILRGASAPMGEYDLLQELAVSLPFFVLSGLDTLALFQRHFLLYHCLYRLQQALWESASGHLQISALAIRLHPYQSQPSTQMAEPDPLRTYYLDLSQLDKTLQSEVNELLASFWQRLARRDTRAEALTILGLSDPIDDKIIQQRYRQLVMSHHPDRGGDTATLQLLNAAMADLIPRR
jgi:hypothetical protein